MNKKIIEKILKFRDERDWKKFHTPENLAKSISIEAGELLECFQWSSNYDKEEVYSELADVFTYSILLAATLDLDIEKMILDKMKTNGKKYPVSKAKGNSRKYTKL